MLRDSRILLVAMFALLGSANPVLAGVAATASVQLASAAASRAEAVSGVAPVMPLLISVKVDPGASVDQTVLATDADGDPLTFSKAYGPPYMTVTTVDPGSGSGIGNIHLAPPMTTPLGPANGSFTVSDGLHLVQAEVNIMISTNPPILDQPSDMTAPEGSVVDQWLTASDLDNDPLTFSVVSGPAFVSVSDVDASTGYLRLAPGYGDSGSYQITVSASDGIASDRKSFTATVPNTDAPPVVATGVDMTLNAGETADQPVTATDFDGDPVTFYLWSGPRYVSVTTVDAGTGVARGNIHVAPTIRDATSPGIGPSHDMVVIRATDGVREGGTSFWVNAYFPPDNPPVLDPPGTMTAMEGAVTYGSLSATDPDGDAFQFSKVDGPDFVVIYGPAATAVRMDPSYSDSGDYTATARVTDSRGLSDEKPFQIHVVNTNAPPDFPGGPEFAGFVGHTSEEDFFATDLDGDPLTFSKISGPDYATVLTVDPGHGTAKGRIRVSPGPADLGSSVVTIGANDGLHTVVGRIRVDVHLAGTVALVSAGYICTTWGAVDSLSLRASDAEGNPITFTESGLPTYGTFTDHGDGTATLIVAPTGSDRGTFVAVTASDGTASDFALVTIMVRPYGSCSGAQGGIQLLSGAQDNPPVARSGGPYSGVAGVLVSFNGSGSTDPDGDPIAFAWTFGDGSMAFGANPSHVYAHGGEYSAALSVTDGYFDSYTIVVAQIADAFAARAFTSPGQSRVHLGPGKPTLSVNVEPVNTSFSTADVDPASISMISSGTGSVDRISAVEDTTNFEDSDGNGTGEISAYFQKQDLRRLFSKVSVGAVDVKVEGNLRTGGKFSAGLGLTLVGAHGSERAIVSPNPINPRGILYFTTSTPGRVTARVFDLSGRLVRTVASSERFDAGDHSLAIDGRDDLGRSMATGIYFYRIEMPDGVAQGRFAVVK